MLAICIKNVIVFTHLPTFGIQLIVATLFEKRLYCFSKRAF